MPELPEVETIKKELSSRIIGSQIVSVKVLRKDVIAYPDIRKFVKFIKSTKIIGVIRQGKYLLFRLNNHYLIVFHLRLSGSIIVSPNRARSKYSRTIFYLRDGRTIQFIEPRALGRVYLIKEGEKPQQLKGLFNLGFEPISEYFNFNYLSKNIKRRKARIKSLLLDQSIAAGVGNIYSDEALFTAGIRPTRRASSLSQDEISRLVRALKKVIRAGIKNLGTSVRDYYRTDGRTGNFQNLLSVYGREDEKCYRCNKKIKIVKFGNRGSRYCPKCQK